MLLQTPLKITWNVTTNVEKANTIKQYVTRFNKPLTIYFSEPVNDTVDILFVGYVTNLSKLPTFTLMLNHLITNVNNILRS